MWIVPYRQPLRAATRTIGAAAACGTKHMFRAAMNSGHGRRDLLLIVCVGFTPPERLQRRNSLADGKLRFANPDLWRRSYVYVPVSGARGAPLCGSLAGGQERRMTHFKRPPAAICNGGHRPATGSVIDAQEQTLSHVECRRLDAIDHD
jgi:hypothetical protein